MPRQPPENLDELKRRFTELYRPPSAEGKPAGRVRSSPNASATLEAMGPAAAPQRTAPARPDEQDVGQFQNKSSAFQHENSRFTPLPANLTIEGDRSRCPIREPGSQRRRLRLPLSARRLTHENPSGWSRLIDELEIRKRREGLQLIALASVHEKEGVTTVAMALVRQLASRTGRRVILVEGDFSNPVFSKRLGLAPAPGLASLLEGRGTIAEAITAFATPPVSILPNESDRKAPVRTTSSKIDSLFRELRESFDWIVVDAARFNMPGETSTRPFSVDGLLLVRQHAKTCDDEIRAFATHCKETGVVVLGTIENEVDMR